MSRHIFGQRLCVRLLIAGLMASVFVCIPVRHAKSFEMTPQGVVTADACQYLLRDRAQTAISFHAYDDHWARSMAMISYAFGLHYAVGPAQHMASPIVRAHALAVADYRECRKQQALSQQASAGGV